MSIEDIGNKMKAARYKRLKDGTYWGEIPGVRGVWGNALRLSECREQIHSALVDWLSFTTRNENSQDISIT